MNTLAISAPVPQLWSLHPQFTCVPCQKRISQLFILLVAADAVSLLEHDERAKTIKQRLHGYVDDSVSADVMLGAQNYLEVIFAGSWKTFIFSAFWLSAIVVVSIFVLPFCGLPVYRSVISETKFRSVTSYGVQISFDRREWTDVDCAESGTG